MTGQGASSSSSSSFITHSWTFDVFLSFRGEDTRYGFTDHLHSNLVRKGIKTFIDDELERGEEISQALLQAIEGSRISVIIFSENYASSMWCLDELVKILECKETKQQTVIPVFYKVDPSDVRHHRGSFGEAIANHKSNFKDDVNKVLKWMAALAEASSLVGWHFLNEPESKFIDNIVDVISEQVSYNSDLNVADYPVGIESRVRNLDNLLCVGGNDVRMVGIWGIGGIGKTTIARALYNSISHKFEGSCFLENVREESMHHGGLVNLQKNLLSTILGGKELEVTNVHGGINVIKKRLSMKRVLLIVDDVNQLAQLKKLVGGCDWFGLGSKIIITTRDEHLLFAHQVSLVFKVNELDHHDALQLFTANAFPGNTLPDDYAKLARAVLQYAQGLPLALIVLGSALCGGSIKEWQDALDSYKKVPNPEIQEILQVSYNSLDDPVKEVFLDIACFFKSENKDRVIQILEGCGLHPSYSIKVLKEKALININEENLIWMHDLVEEMGKEVVRQESPTEPGRRSRLWFHEDVYRVLTEGRGTSKVIGILARLPKPYEIRLNTRSFSKLTNLQMFVNENAIFTSHLTMDLPDELRFIDWPELQYISLPFNNIPEKLVKLNMPYGFMSQLGLGFKCCGNLKYINLESCQLLMEFPDVSEFPNLEELNLNYCVNLVEVHYSVGYLDRLVSLSLSGCHSLAMIVSSIALKSVKYINLGGCRSLQKFPRILEIMECLTCLSLSGTAIKELPSSIGYLINLEELILENCENLTTLPCSIYQLKRLVSVNLLGCRKLVTFPKWSPEFSHDLWYLNLRGCKSLKEIPELPPKVEWVDASNCVSLGRFAKLSNILENNESQVIQCISLLNCEQLCDNLASEVAKKENISLYEVSLCSLFLSPKKYEYELEVLFPGVECPKWFKHREDSYELVDKSEFCFKIPGDFKLENAGLAICAAVDINKIEIQESKSGGEISQKGKEEEIIDQTKSGVETSQKEEEITQSNFGRCTFVARIGINAESIVERTRYFEAKDMDLPHVLLLYIPIVMLANGPLPPATCRVSLEHNSDDSVRCKSYGVHLVMPEDEDLTDDEDTMKN